MIDLQKLEEITDLSSENGPKELTLAQSLDILLPTETVNIKDVEYKVIAKYINSQNEIVIKMEHFNQDTRTSHTF